MALVAKVKLRTAPGADRATLQALPVKVDRTKVFAVAAVLPSDLNGGFAQTFEIKFAKQVDAILSFDRALARREEASFVLGTKYSHLRSSL